MDPIEQIMDRLAEATDQELAEALEAVGTEAGSVGDELNEDNVARLERLAEARKAIAGEQERRTALADRAQNARGAFADDSEGEGPEGEPNDGESADEGSDGDDNEGSDGESDDEEGEDAVTASGKTKLGGISKAAGKAPAPTAAGRVTTTTRATGATATYNNGQQLNWGELTDALLEKHNSLNRSGVQGKQVVSRTEFSYPEERTLSSEVSAGVNTGRIKAATSQEAITAAGGLCAPLDTQYDINVLGVTDRPVRDALSQFAVDRGGIQYRMPMSALEMTDGLGVWTVTDDEGNDDPDAPVSEKTCAVIECPGVEEAVVYSTYLCLQYPNFTARFDQEWVDATTQAAMVAHARFAENQLLTQLFNGSKLLFGPAVGTTSVSAVRDVLVALDKTIAYYRNRHRLDTMVPLRMILPRWVLDLFRADMVRSMGSAYDSAALAITDAAIRTWFTNRGVNPTFHLDGLAESTVTPPGAGDGTVPQQFYDNAAAGSAIPDFIEKLDTVLFAEGDWLYLNGGTLDLGLVRDSRLNRINRYQTFVENWEGTAFNGVESLRLLLPVEPTGGVVGTVDPSVFISA